MAVSPSSSAQQARQALGERLREVRLAADFGTVRAFAAACRWHESKVSRIEHGRQLPSEADLRTWCAACRTEGQLAELVGMARAVDSMYTEWRRIHAAGLRQVQERVTTTYQGTRRHRFYQSSVVPGVLQTPEYAQAVLSTIAGVRDLPSGGVDEAVTARMDRARYLREGGATFAIVIEEAVLRSRLADADTMAGQLGHLLITMTLPSVSVGVIPLSADRSRWPMESFSIADNTSVEIELLSARVQITQRAEIELYESAFTDLSKLAVHGQQARRLITTAIDALG